jgi:hypothetical protein
MHGKSILPITVEHLTNLSQVTGICVILKYPEQAFNDQLPNIYNREKGRISPQKRLCIKGSV